MGFILDVDLETSEGPSHEVYVRMESLTFNKVTSMAQFQITYWHDQSQAIKFNRTYLSEQKKNAVGLIQEKVIYFEDPESEGVEILFPHHLKVPVVREDTVDVPVYEMKEVQREVPYISFDENGDEITKTRVVTREEQVKVGTRTKVEQVIDGTLLNNIFGFCYEQIRKELEKYLPSEKIITVK